MGGSRGRTGRRRALGAVFPEIALEGPRPLLNAGCPVRMPFPGRGRDGHVTSVCDLPSNKADRATHLILLDTGVSSEDGLSLGAAKACQEHRLAQSRPHCSGCLHSALPCLSASAQVEASPCSQGSGIMALFFDTSGAFWAIFSDTSSLFHGIFNRGSEELSATGDRLDHQLDDGGRA